ncbi:MAG: sigma-70 family RNA polymerase sigma factor [Terrimicrobiaceae bacterium]|nr:sigma-70 family RNA polymerase sigma factor [Terrimicrobiaceae bacterium]
MAPPGDAPRVVEHLFRHEWGRMVATLTRIFGVEHLELAEDVVQEALSRALQTWPYYGVPKNPPAWIMRVSRNLALDHVRRATTFRNKETAIANFLEHMDAGEPVFSEDEIRDDSLRLMFVCCHPEVSQEAQVALALKTLCGFSHGEIAQAFLSSEAAIAKRLTRARQRIQEQGIPFEIPSGAALSTRLEGVLQVLYLLFNEGYKASSGENVVREELCAEAIRLATLLVEHPVGDGPATHALLALMLLNGARLPARVDGEGNFLRLEEQDRSQWSRAMIERGILHLGQSAVGNALSRYHLEAGIAACHCTASDYASTDWPQILSLYNRLAELDPSPIVALNRAVAVAKVHGPAKGIASVEAILNARQLGSYHLLHAILGEFEAELEHFQVAADHLRNALRLSELTPERVFLANRLRDCEEKTRTEKNGRDVLNEPVRSSRD